MKFPLIIPEKGFSYRLFLSILEFCGDKNDMYEFPQKLTNDLKLGILGN